MTLEGYFSERHSSSKNSSEAESRSTPSMLKAVISVAFVAACLTGMTELVNANMAWIDESEEIAKHGLGGEMFDTLVFGPLRRASQIRSSIHDFPPLHLQLA